MLQQAKGWPFQLLSVACLSLAAKMEEPHVPQLLDFQILEPGFIFEPKTVQRMELRVMANLNWRLSSVTSFDYLDYFISKLPSCFSPKPDNFNQFFTACSDLILSTTRGNSDPNPKPIPILVLVFQFPGFNVLFFIYFLRFF